MSNNNFDPVKEKHEAHAKLINRFGGFEAYFDFVLQRQEERIKQGVRNNTPVRSATALLIKSNCEN